MLKRITTVLITLSLFACGGGRGSSAPATEVQDQGDGLNPTVRQLETPPVNGVLPKDLLPPA